MDFIQNLYGRPSTIKTYSCLYNKWLAHELPMEMSHQNILKLVRYWEGKDLAPRTIKTLLNLMKKYHLWTDGELLDTRRYVTTLMGKQQQAPVKALTREQALAVLDELNDSRAFTFAMIAYYTGMRKGEIFGLNWDDVDFLEGRIFVQRSYDGPTKNGRSRFIGLCEQLETHLLDKSMEKSDNYLETRVIVKQFDPNPDIKAACRSAQVPEITAHGFRHTFATLALDSDRPIKQVSEALGHSNVSITMDVYLANVKGDLKLGFC